MKIFFTVLLMGIIVTAALTTVNGLNGKKPQPPENREAVGFLPPISHTPHSVKAFEVNEQTADSAGTVSVDITATSAYMINVESNTVLYQKNSHEHIAPASTSKLLTALTVLEYCSPDDTFRVGQEIDLINSDSSRAWLSVGEVLTVRQLLVALLLPSGNDAAYTLAVNTGRMIAGDSSLTAGQAVDRFVDGMNRKAREVGADSSNFLTPDGTDADGQHTTAYDLARIAVECLSHDALNQIVSSYRISDTWADGREVTYHNTNELLNPRSPYYFPHAVGLKTGNSEKAGGCLISAATINNRTYICVVMGSTESGRFSDSLSIYNEIEPIPSDSPGVMPRPKNRPARP